MTAAAGFRQEVRAWLEANCPLGARHVPPRSEGLFWGGRKPHFPSADLRLWFERMAERGWTVPTWPAIYGGGGLDRAEASILAQELRRIDAASPLMSIGIWMLGPALLKFGTEEQKRKFLPPIARGEIRWAQGYSEPSAGSDLANVQTKGELRPAPRGGEQWVIDGHKIWTSYGHESDMIFALVRTEPDASKHEGISFLLVDMDQPGVEAQPIRLINGDQHFAEVFFHDATTPVDHIVGARGQGWTVAKYLLDHEREMIGSMMGGAADAEPFENVLAREIGRERLAREPALRSAISQNLIDGWAMQIAVERLDDQARAGTASPSAPSILKVFGTELQCRRTELAMAVGGLDALIEGGATAHEWLSAPPNCVGGGSTEIQLNILARRALELPET